MKQSEVKMPRQKITIQSLLEKKRLNQPIVQLAVYDYRDAVIADQLDVDILCVSDTGAAVLFGHEDTTSVTFEEVMLMAQAVKRGSKHGLRMVDMPYMSYHLSQEQAIESAATFVAKAGAEVMKCEGNQHHAKNIEAIVKAGIPVQGHIGICPMRLAQQSGFRAHGKTAVEAAELIDDAMAFYEAGCFSILCEVVASEVAEKLASLLPIPIISLGSGNRTNGVHIIGSDLFNLADRTPRHAKTYVDLVPIITKGYQDYIADVKSRAYPGPEHTVFMKPEELKLFRSQK
jgi:3-methyl-2-oxobutanoate hydroxymethyltransferase